MCPLHHPYTGDGRSSWGCRRRARHGGAARRDGRRGRRAGRGNGRRPWQRRRRERRNARPGRPHVHAGRHGRRHGWRRRAWCAPACRRPRDGVRQPAAAVAGERGCLSGRGSVAAHVCSDVCDPCAARHAVLATPATALALPRCGSPCDDRMRNRGCASQHSRWRAPLTVRRRTWGSLIRMPTSEHSKPRAAMSTRPWTGCCCSRTRGGGDGRHCCWGGVWIAAAFVRRRAPDSDVKRAPGMGNMETGRKHHCHSTSCN